MPGSIYSQHSLEEKRRKGEEFEMDIDPQRERDMDTKDEPPSYLPKPSNVFIRMSHSFKRSNPQIPNSYDPELSIPTAGDTSKLHRKLKSRHIQMIAIGGAIGAGLFIGSGKALALGGPGTLILDFSVIGFMLFCTINALGELATMFPVQGIIFF
jgi:amino acid permease